MKGDYTLDPRFATWEVKKFADKLKETIALWLGIDRKELEYDTVKDSLLSDEWQVFTLSNWGKELPTFFHTEVEAQEFCLAKNNSQHRFTYTKSERTVRWLLQYMGYTSF
jgi:hypothetical protein